MEEKLQGTDEWMQKRVGKVTASRMNDVCAKIKSGEAAARKNYRAQLVAERLTGQKAESYQNAAMLWGIEKEPEAKALFTLFTDIRVEDVGFIDHPTIQMSGASPDGFTSDGGLIECKCPLTATHIDYLIKDVVPTEYVKQIMWQMECTGKKFCHFVSYDPRMPEDLQLFTKKICFDEKIVHELKVEVIHFLKQVDDVVETLTKSRRRNAT